MKLSKKGRDRLYGSHNVFYDDDIEGDVVALYELSEVWEFEPDDFQGIICLTVDEAKILENFCWRCAPLLSTEEDAVHDKLVERIEQAEMSIASTQCENVSKKDEKVITLTVEEAKEAIADYINVVAEVVRKRNEPEIKIKHPKSIRLLMEKVEQSEM